jgi:vacuolar-type H+-ATPase subunit H
MRTLIVGLCAVTVGISGALFAAPAGAAPPAPATSKLCKLLTGIKIDPSSDLTAAGGKENAKNYSKALTKAAKQAKGDIKSTLKTLAKYFKAIANEDTQAIQDQAQDFARAETKYANYVVQNCVSQDLPSGVTIPKIPGS